MIYAQIEFVERALNVRVNRVGLGGNVGILDHWVELLDVQPAGQNEKDVARAMHSERVDVLDHLLGCLFGDRVKHESAHVVAPVVIDHVPLVERVTCLWGELLLLKEDKIKLGNLMFVLNNKVINPTLKFKIVLHDNVKVCLVVSGQLLPQRIMRQGASNRCLSRLEVIVSKHCTYRVGRLQAGSIHGRKKRDTVPRVLGQLGFHSCLAVRSSLEIDYKRFKKQLFHFSTVVFVHSRSFCACSNTYERNLETDLPGNAPRNASIVTFLVSSKELSTIAGILERVCSHASMSSLVSNDSRGSMTIDPDESGVRTSFTSTGGKSIRLMRAGT
jgi:hypothetical protein